MYIWLDIDAVSPLTAGFFGTFFGAAIGVFFASN